jgi:universal stress protein A
MNAITKILVPIDFSEYSEDVVALAADLSRRYDAPLHLLHVHQAVTYSLPGDSLVLTGEQLSQVVKMLTQLLDDLKRDAQAKVKSIVEATLTQGFPAGEIVRCAKDWGCDLIVMGTHGRTGIKHLLIGSVAENVVRMAPCPVLTVHARPRHS